MSLLNLVFFYFLVIEANSINVNATVPVINKCCSLDKYITVHDKKPFKRCSDYNEGANFTDVAIYDKNFVKTSESLGNVFDILPGKFKDGNFRKYAMDIRKIMLDVNLYLTKEGILIFEVPNVYNRLHPIQPDHFCIDYTRTDDYGTAPRFWVLLEEDTPPSHNGKLLTIAMSVSSVFLLIVLIVYGLLPELRNLCGMILMAYVSSLFGAFVLLAIVRSFKFDDGQCINITCATYFFFLATFCWMNVMSYDIWWTFRGYAKARPIHRRGEWFKFAMYSIYAYGVPFAMTVFLRIINDVNLTHKPWFIKPGIPRLGCFIQGGEKLVYLYVPMMILILSNWLFYLMTAFNVWRLSRGTAVLDSAAAGTPAAHRSHRQRFLVYLKLSVVMGLNWALEVVSFLMPSLNNVWWISDAYNLLIGVIIFVIFVCKPKIIKKLVKILKPQNFKKWVPSSSTKSNISSVDNSSSQETQTMQVCADPKGPVYTTHKY